MDNERSAKRPRVSRRPSPPVTIEDDFDPDSPSSLHHSSDYIYTCSDSASASNTAAAGASSTPHEGMAAGHAVANSSPLGPLGRTDVCETLSPCPDVAVPSTEPSASAPASPILIPPSVSLVATKCDTESVAFHELPLATLNFKALTVALLSHSVPLSGKKRKLDILRDLAFAHRCNDECRDSRFFMQASFSTPKAPPPPSEVREKLSSVLSDTFKNKFPMVVGKEKRRKIVEKWIDNHSNANMRQVICAVCSERVLATQSSALTLSDAQLDLLRNDTLPLALRPDPTGTFGSAILDPAGFAPTEDEPRALIVCNSCKTHLKAMNLPPLSLANNNYTGYDKVPQDIRDLFHSATAVELSLIARYRVRCTIHKFSSKTGGSDHLSQKYMQGNTITFANDCNGLLDVLPPTRDVVGETICVMFVGSVFPSPEELKRFTPILARRQVVHKLLTWLKANNPYYQDIAISMSNLNDLLPDESPSIPQGISTRLVSSAIKETESATYVPDTSASAQSSSKVMEDNSDNIPMSSHGVLGQSIEGMSIREVKLLAIQHWKSGGGAYTVPHGQKPINEYDNPGLFPCMFPHLFPFGLGGFEDRQRSVPVSMEAHIKHQLNCSDTRFETDNCFGFVAMNILQRRATSRASRFKVSKKNLARASSLLSSVEASTCATILERARGGDKVSPLDDKERQVFELLDKVNVLSGDVPGSSASKVRLRNSIRSLMHWSGMPTFFITINPADVYSPLFCHFAGVPTDLDAQSPNLPNDYERRRLLARNPAAGARFFHSIMRAFFDIIVAQSDTDGGLFGNVKAYYGTIEAQGRGSLHCHLLLWVAGNPGPEHLREKLSSDERYKNEVFKYVEDAVKNALPDDTKEVSIKHASAPPRPDSEVHPCSVRCPDPRKLQDKEFNDEWSRQLLRTVLDCNYHIHTDTCWKYLKPGDPKDHDHCRMRMNGATRAKTMLDPETGSILLRRFHPWINNYNELVIMLVKSNMDIKFIGSGAGAKALIYYVTDYITKASLPTYVGFAALQHVLEIHENPESGLLAELSGDGETEKRGRTVLVKAANALLANQEISGQQVMMNLLRLADGEGDHYRSHTFRVLYWASAMGWLRAEEKQEDGDRIVGDNADQESETATTISSDFESERNPFDDEDLRKDSDVSPPLVNDPIVCSQNTSLEHDDDNVILDLEEPGSDLTPQSQLLDYRLRGAEFQDMPLYWFASCTERLTVKSEEKRLAKRKRNEDNSHTNIGRTPTPRSYFLLGHPQRETHLLRFRDAPVVPILIGPSIPRRGHDSISEDYAKTMLLLFKPWRTLHDLRPESVTWIEAFEQYSFDDNSLNVMANMNHLHECKDARDHHMELRQKGLLVNDFISGDIADARPARLDDEGSLLNVLEELAPHLVQVENDDVSSRKDKLDGFTSLRNKAMQIEAKILVASCQQAGFFSTNENALTVAVDSATPWIPSHSSTFTSQQAELKALQADLISSRFMSRQDDSIPSVIPDASTSPDGPQPKIAFAESFQPAPPQLATINDVDISSSLPSPVLLAEVIAKDYGLNEEQTRALVIVARRIDDLEETQMIMFVGGAGGTGKTRVIDAVSTLFERLQCSHRLRKAAPTGVAARLIGGSTIHSLLSLTRGRVSQEKLEKMQDMWKSATHLCLDEASMYGARLLSKISSRLGVLRKSDLPFGGLNVIFSGDLCQLPAVGDTLLWNRQGGKHSSVEVAASAAPKPKEQEAAHGRGLWMQINEAVFLKENYRARRDPRYVELTEHIQQGHARQADYDDLKSRVVSRLLPTDIERFVDAPLVTADKTLRDAWNEKAVKSFASKTGGVVHNYCAIDSIQGENVTGNLRSELLDLTASTLRCDVLGRLPLVKGMRVMVLENILTEMGVVNGSDGILEDVVYEEVDGLRVVKAAYVKVPGSGLRMAGLDPDVVPIMPKSTSITLSSGKRKSVTFSRSQIPLLPAYAMTDYKSQGQSLELVIIDLASAHRQLASAYVMVSRATCLDNVLVLRDFDFERINRRMHYSTFQELKRLQKVAEETSARYEL